MTRHLKRKSIGTGFITLCFWAVVILLPYLCYRSFTLPLQFPDDYSEQLMVVCAAIYVCFLAGLWLFVKKIPENRLVIFGWILIGAAGAVQLFLVDQMQLLPEIDLAYTLSQNKAMVEEGLHTFTNKGYFSVYTNNIPLTIVIYWVFRLAKALGCHNYELAGGVFNAGMNVVTYAMGYCIARKITSERTAFLLLTVLLTNPALYAYAAYYYTDTISLAITSLAIYWFVCALQTKPGHTGKKTMLFCISGMAIYWAARIRVTSIFILIAAAVYALLRGGGQWKRVLKTALPVIAGMIVAGGIYSILYQYHVPFDTTDSSITWQHFVAMGANVDTTGRYSHDDFVETTEQPTHQEKVSYNVSKWQKRVKDNGIAGGFKLICDKEAIVWSFGSKQYYQYIQFVKVKNPIYDWIEGEHSIYFRSYMQAYNSIFLTAILISVVIAICKRKMTPMVCVAAIDWLGAVMFYVLWEAHPRQSVSYLLIMSMMLIPLLEMITSDKVDLSLK